MSSNPVSAPSPTQQSAGIFSRMGSALSNKVSAIKNTAYDYAVAKPASLANYYASAAASKAQTLTSAAWSTMVVKPASMMYSAAANGISTAKELGHQAKDTYAGLKKDPVRKCVEIGNKAVPLWNKIPGYAKTAAGAAALWAAPQVMLAGVWKAPVLGYLGWRHIPAETQEGIKQLPPVAKVIETVEPIVSNLKQISASAAASASQTSFVFGGKEINPVLTHLYPAPDSNAPLARTKKAAANVLKIAGEQGVRSEQIDDRRVSDPDPSLPVTPAPGENPIEPPAVEPVPVINLSVHTFPPATGPKEPTSPIDMKAETDRHLDKLCKKLSDFSTLSYMAINICGVKERDYSSLLQLVSAASTPGKDGESPSIWELFTTRFKPTLWQKVRAGLFYFWLHKVTGLIPKTVETYLKRFINEVRTQLTDKNSNENSDKHVQKAINNANGFLNAYNLATEDFLADKIPTFSTLNEYRENRIAMHYGGSLWEALNYPGPGLETALDASTTVLEEQMNETNRVMGFEIKFEERPDNALLVKPYMERARRILSKKFSQVLINSFSPHVEFFKNWKTHSAGKYFSFFYSPIEWLLNKFLRNAMKNRILPPIFSSAIKGGIDSTSRHNLPFSIALTKFFSAQIKKLGEIMDKPAEDAKAELFPPPAIEHLGELVKQLLTTLDQVPLETKEDFQRYKQQKKSDFDQKLQKDLEKSITEASKFLFQYLAQPENAEGMFAQLLDLSNSAFSDSVSRTDAEYIKQKKHLEDDVKDLKEEANKVFKALIRKSVEQEIKGAQPEQAQEKAGIAFHDQKQEAMGAFDQLYDLSRCMLEHVREADELNIHAEIATFAQIMKTFAGREKVYNEIEGLNPADKEGIQRVLTPLYERAESIMETLELLQNTQKIYLFHAKIDAELTAVEKGVRSVIGKQFHPQIRARLLSSISEQELSALERRFPGAEGFKFPPAMRDKLLGSIPEPELAEIEKELRLLDRFRFTPEKREEIGNSIAEIDKILPNSPEIAQEYLRLHRNLCARFDQIVAEDNLLREIEALGGHIENLVDYRRGEREQLPRGFRIRACQEEIKNILATIRKNKLLPEIGELEARINEVQDPLAPDFNEKWERLGSLCTHIRNSHEGMKRVFISKLKNSRQAFLKFNEDKRGGNTLRKNQNLTQMEKGVESIAEELKKLKEDAIKIEKHPQFQLTESRIGVGAAVLTTLSAGLGAAIGQAAGWPLAGAATASSFFSTLLNRGLKKKNFEKVIDNQKGKIREPLVTAALAGATAAAVPAALAYPDSALLNGAAALLSGGAIAASEYVGYNAGSAAVGQAVETGEDKVLPEVLRHFENAYNFVTQSQREHISHGTITRLMMATIDSHMSV